MREILTKAEAMKQTYGFNTKYRPEYCVERVHKPGRGRQLYQCQRKPGHGPEGLYCKQHAQRYETKGTGRLLYRIDDGFEHATKPTLVSGEILRETPLAYVLIQDDRCHFRYADRILKEEAHLTPEDAWTAYRRTIGNSLRCARAKVALLERRLQDAAD